MADRYPGYDVLAKRHTPSWNEQTRRAIDRRLAIPREPRVLTADEYATVTAIADRMTPQPKDRPPIPVAALIDDKLYRNVQEGYRAPKMPQEREAWRQGLSALDAEAQTAYGIPFRALSAGLQDALLGKLQNGELHNKAWGDMPPKTFFKQRVAHDISNAYWSHPTAWNEIGWGGPASPRGYVRMGYDKRDPWEATEAKPGDGDAAYRKNRRAG